MIIEKYQVITRNNNGTESTGGGILVLEIPPQSPGSLIVASQNYLFSNGTYRYFLKSSDPEVEPTEFVPSEEITSALWAADPAPHVYKITLVLPR
jgi:hypothetical protein